MPVPWVVTLWRYVRNLHINHVTSIVVETRQDDAPSLLRRYCIVIMLCLSCVQASITAGVFFTPAFVTDLGTGQYQVAISS